MLPLALLLACAGHADPAIPAQLEVEGVVVTLSDESQLSAEKAAVGDDGKVKAAAVVAKDGSLEIHAPQTEWDLKTRTATLTGGVRATRGAVVLQCAQMVVNFSSPGRVATATATGDVRVSHGARRGTADRAVLSTADGQIVLTGSPALVDGANQMRGSKIVLHMDAEKVRCDDCRLQIAPDAVRPGTPSP